MKKIHTYFTALAMLSLFGSLKAQVFESDTTAKQVITQSGGQTFTHTVTNIPSGLWGVATLVVFYDGDFGDNTEYLEVFDIHNNLIGRGGPNRWFSDCGGRDSFEVQILADSIVAWTQSGSCDFVIRTSNDVDDFCADQYTQVKLIVNYCSFGVPDPARFTNIFNELCPLDNKVELSGLPAGGVFSGQGVVGDFFYPNLVTPGTSVKVSYKVTDAIGCETTANVFVNVKKNPRVESTYACPNTSPEITINKAGTYMWALDKSMTPIIDSGQTVVFDPIATSTSYYVAERFDKVSFFNVQLDSNNAAVVDHSLYSGDDRGGIAVTQDYIFVVGDNNTVRANASDLSNMVSLPIQDALFSDLHTGELFSLWSSVSAREPNDNDAYVLVDAIRGLDTNMNFTNEIAPISIPFMVDYYSLILAGKGFVGVLSGDNNNMYVINLRDYTVQNLGHHPGLNYYGSENWADWGVLEFDGVNFYALYRDASLGLTRYDFANATKSSAATFDQAISDLSSFTVSPWNNRWYFHYESSAYFGGSSETMGYADASFVSSITEYGSLGCVAKVDVTVSSINLGNDTTVCKDETPFMIFAGTGYTSYTWNGVNNNYNAFPVMQSGEYIVNAIDAHNCNITDTITVLVDICLGIEEAESNLRAILFPNPAMDVTSLKLIAPSSVDVNIAVMDMNGRVLSVEKQSVVSGENTIQLNVSSLSSGVYMVRVLGEQIHNVLRFVKL